jgi:hypothetical protein
MTTYIQNYGVTKTLINNNNNVLNNEIKWEGIYDGSKANIYVDINDNGKKEIIKMNLDNDDIKQLLGISSVEIPLEERLTNDFLNPYGSFKSKRTPRSIVLEGALTNKTRKNKWKLRNKKRNRKTKSKTIS